ncbi:MAG: lysylphosphatidylglycerol synthase transmembrane domain-containing protein [Candidatus Bathyarchaeia archaeon]
MVTTKPQLTWKTTLFSIVGLTGFFLYIYIFNVDVLAIIATAQRAEPTLFIIAILISLAEVFFYAVSWHTLLNALKVKLSVLKANLFVWYGIFVDIIVPAESVSGELCRVYLVTREQNGSGGRAAASVVLQRLMGMGINVVVLLMGIMLFLGEGQISSVIFNIIAFFTVTIAVLLLLFITLAFKQNLSLKVINTMLRIGEFITRGKLKLFNKLKEETQKSAKAFHDSMQEYRHKPREIVVSLFWLIINWTCSLSIPYVVFLSLKFQVSWSTILITAAIVVAVKSVPIGIPFEVGLPEITMTTLYVGLGIPAEISATTTLLTRFITLWLRFAIGFIAQQCIELKPVIIPNTTKTTTKNESQTSL